MRLIGKFRYRLLIAVFSVLTLNICPGTVQAQIPLRQYDPTLRLMLDAIQSKSYEQFMSSADARFKTQFTLKMFEDLTRQMGEKLQQGYSITYLTTMNQQDYAVFVWKIVFKGVKDDYLITLFVKDGNVSGFVMR